MSTLVERCQLRADKANDDHIATAEWKALISEVYGHDVHSVVSETGLRYFEYAEELTPTGAGLDDGYLTEPDDHFATIRIDYVDSSGKHRELTEVNVMEEPYLIGQSASGPSLYYAVIDDRIYLYPPPGASDVYELRYIPQPPDLSDYADDDVIDVVTADGEACLIWGVAALAKIKAQQDASIYLQKQEMHRNRLQTWAAERAITQARTRPAHDEYGPRGYDPGDYR
jgi:hypothetical protein